VDSPRTRAARQAKISGRTARRPQKIHRFSTRGYPQQTKTFARRSHGKRCILQQLTPTVSAARPISLGENGETQDKSLITEQ
jgi:hypothetical protein